MLSYRLKLIPLTPVHVGTGDAISPFDYVLKEPEGADQPFLFRFDPMKVMARLVREKPTKAAEIANMADHRRAVLALHEEIDVAIDAIYSTPAGAIGDLYLEKRADPENQLLVHTMQRNPGTGAAVIPGSSLKGALRTAILAEKMPARPFRVGRIPSEMDYASWSGPAEDPLRALKLADCIFPLETNEFVAEVFNYSRKKGSLNSIQMIFEQIDGVEAWSPGQVHGICNARIDDRLADKPPLKQEGRNAWRGLAFKVSMEGIASACNRFYGERLREENRAFFRAAPGSVVQEARDCLNRLEARLENLPGNAFIIRLGRFSHFECVTLDRGRSSPRVSHGATRNLSHGLFPLGWVEVHWEPEGAGN